MSSGSVSQEPNGHSETHEEVNDKTAEQSDSQHGLDEVPASSPKPGIMARLGLDKPTMLTMLKCVFSQTHRSGYLD